MAADTALQKKLRKAVREAGGIFIMATPAEDDGCCAVLYAVLCSDRVFNAVLWLPLGVRAIDELKRSVADTAKGKIVKAKSAAATGGK
jgi:hypothetical protein